MAFTGKETPEKSDEHVSIATLSGALTWEPPREKTTEPRTLAHRTFTYAMKVTEFWS
jgi:hypothetical protein